MRKIAYAVRMPNAIAPMDAQINIAKFNISAIQSAPGVRSIPLVDCGFYCKETSVQNTAAVSAIVSEDAAALTLISVAK